MSEPQAMGPLLQSVADVLTATHSPFSVGHNGQSLGFCYFNAHLVCNFRVLGDEGAGLIMLRAQIPVLIPPRQRLAALMLLNRRNLPHPLGWFALDETDGEVSFIISNYALEGRVSKPLFGALLTAATDALDEFVPELLELGFGKDDGQAGAEMGLPLASPRREQNL